MATYYKYAERSADSQINWAEIGKSMSDMLANETRIREEKKAAIDAASREFGNTLANPPQGEHKGANQWALEYADNASKFMLMQDKLLKSGQMKLKDYTVARQNILDGTDQAFNLSKDFQAVFAEKMERYKTDKSQDLEQWLMAQAEGYSDFNKSQLYINPTDGTLSVAMKEKKVVDGKEVYVMNKNPNQFTSISTLKNQIAGKYDKYNTNEVTDAFVKGLGEEVTSAITKAASLTSGGVIQSIEDIRNRKDIDPATKQILYQFSDSETQFIKSALTNPFDRLSVLTNSKKFAPNGKQYTFTYDEADAKANPEKVLLRKDPRSNQPTPDFSEEQMKVSEDFMRTELRAKYTRKQELKTTPQAQLQERRAPTPTEVDINEKRRAAKNVAQNLVYSLTGNPNESAAGTKYLSSSTGLPFTKTKEGFIVEDENGNVQTFKFKADGKTLADPTKFTKSFIGTISRKMGINEDDVIQEFGKLLPKGAKLNEATEAVGFEAAQPTAAKIAITPDLFTVRSEKSSQRLRNILPAGFDVKEDTGALGLSNDVIVTAPNKKTYTYNANVSAEEAATEKIALEKFIRENGGSAAGATKAATKSTVAGGNVR